MKFTFNKKDRLKSQKLIEKLFLEGKSVTSFPLKLIYLKTEVAGDHTIKAGVSVSKRNFKKAVDRNRIKRLLRECYRLNRDTYFNNISTSYALMILYIGRNQTDFDTINSNIKILLSSFIEKISKDKKQIE